MAEQRKVFIVEDDAKVMDLLSQHLERYDYKIAQIADLRFVTDEIRCAKPDLILLDINLPFYDGFYWCRQLRMFTTAPILFLSARDNNMDQVMALEFGADDYITKPFHPDLVLAKVRALLRRSYGEYAKDEGAGRRVIQSGELILDLPRGEIQAKGTVKELTRTELKLLDSLVSAGGEIVSRDTLLSDLWDESEFVDDNTLTVNVARLRKKLAEAGEKSAIATVRGAGYRWTLDISSQDSSGHLSSTEFSTDFPAGDKKS